MTLMGASKVKRNVATIKTAGESTYDTCIIIKKNVYDNL